MGDDEDDLPDFPEGLSTGDEVAEDGTQNMCLPFCISLWKSDRWVPWKSLVFCGPTREAILKIVDFFIRGLAKMGFQARATEGNCPPPR